MRDSVASTLVRAGMEVQTVDGGQAAIDSISRKRPDCIVSDLKMPGMTGIELLAEVRKIDEDVPVILMTAFATVETAVKALKIGAFDYLSKPFEGDELIISVKRAIEHGRLKRENALLRAGGTIGGNGGGGGAGRTASAGRSGLSRLIGSSLAMRKVREQVLAVAESAGTVLISGESGVGKEVVAHALHELSPRSGAPFVGLNCAALSESLLESELFGHEKGAFTGADRLRKGRFELAEQGTLLLDEISEIPVRLQAKLLRVLQERVFERVGSSIAIGCDVRVVATSNQDLHRAIARGGFRQDLFFRLNVLPIHLPALRERTEDIAELAEHFLHLSASRDGRPSPKFSPEAIKLLGNYNWPGNVRELNNICERAAVLCRELVIPADMVRPWLERCGPLMPQGAVAVRIAAGSEIDNVDVAAESRVDELATTVGIGSGSNINGLNRAVPIASGFPGGSGHTVEVKPVSFGLPNTMSSNTSGGVANSGGFGQAANGSAVPIVDRLLEDIERDTIIHTLNRFNGHRQRTAQVLGIGVRTLGLKLKKWKELKLVDAAL